MRDPRQKRGWRWMRFAALAATLGQGAPAFAQSVAGVWTGQYDCAQGATGLALQISEAPAGALRAVFYFHPLAENPGVPEGCFEMSGRYDAAGGTVRLVAGRWLLQPPGYVTVDLSADIDPEAGDMTGTVAGPGCEEFQLHRLAGAPAGMPAACLPDPVS